MTATAPAHPTDSRGSIPGEWPRVAVIVVNWNGEAHLARCLRALALQTAVPHEVLVVDNASSDASVAVVRSFASVKLIEPGLNTGFAQGNNIAIAAASPACEWIALMNPDAFAEPRWLEALLLASLAHPRFDVFGSQLLNAAEPSLLDGAGDAYHVSGLVWRRGHGLPARSQTAAPAAATAAAVDTAYEVFSPCAAAALYRRSCLAALGGFDEDYFCYVEDVDLAFRLRLMQHRCLQVPDSVVHHIGSGTTGGQDSDFAIYHGHRNMVWAFVKNMPGVLFWLLLPLHIALNLATIAFFVKKGQGGVILRAKRDALLGLPRVWKKRRVVQKNRLASLGDIWRLLDKTIWPARAARDRKRR